MTSFVKPTIKEIYETIINDYNTRTGEQIPLLQKSLIKCFSYAIAGLISFLWNFATWQYLQIFVETCEFEALKRWGDLVNIIYKTGTKTILTIEIETNTINIIEAGTIWKSLNNGLIYKSISSVNPINSKTIINIEASESGVIGNLNNNEILNLINPIIGISDQAIVINTLIIGSENETIENYRERVSIRYKRKPQGGSAIDYFLWATEVAGIIDCLPYVLNSGIVSLYLVANGSGSNRTPTGNLETNPFPEWENGEEKELIGNGQLLQVANAINGLNNVNDRRPINTQIQLLKPNYKEYKIEINELTPLNNSIVEQIKTSIIKELDKKRPNIKSIGYNVNNATINSNQLSSIVQNILTSYDGSFVNFTLKNTNNSTILTDILNVGCLAYLGELKINGSVIDL